MKKYKKLYLIFKIFLAIFLLLEALIVFFPKNDKSSCDYVVVLGALVNKYEISQSLKNRLDKCIEYIENNEEKCYIIVSGGKGRGECVTEASAMKNYLIENGIDEKLILKEEKSTTTKENFIFSKEIIKNHSQRDFDNLYIKVITTDFHAFRSKIISNRCGYFKTTFYTAASNYKLAILNYTREFFAIIINLFFNY